MSLLRASIPDDRGRQVRLLRMCMLGRIWQRGEARTKFEIETPVRLCAKSCVAAVALTMALMVLAGVAMFFVLPVLVRSGPPAIWSALFPGLVWPVFMLGVWMPAQAAITARWASAELRNAYLANRRCPCCFYSLAEQPTEPDGCCVCPECGAAWRIETAAPPRLFPMPALEDDRGRWMPTGIPLRRRLGLAWDGASSRAQFDLVAATVILIVLAPFFGRFVGPYVSDGLEALIRARWGRTIDNAVSLFFAVVAAAGVLSVACLLWRGFWRSHMLVAQKRRGRCAACDAPLPPAVAGGDGLVECGCGATWLLALENSDGSDRTS